MLLIRSQVHQIHQTLLCLPQSEVYAAQEMAKTKQTPNHTEGNDDEEAVGQLQSLTHTVVIRT